MLRRRGGKSLYSLRHLFWGGQMRLAARPFGLMREPAASQLCWRNPIPAAMLITDRSRLRPHGAHPEATHVDLQFRSYACAYFYFTCLCRILVRLDPSRRHELLVPSDVSGRINGPLL